MAALAKILLADDSTHAQRMGVKILTAEGHEVSTVSNGQAAIHSLEQALPELVIADVFMPGRNGYEVCHFVKTDEKLKSIPVLLIIGAMEPYDPEEGRRAGADGLITKPLESSSLVSTVNDLLSAAKRFAPARVPLTPSGRILMVDPANAAVEKKPEWDDSSEELITTRTAEKLEIPKELNHEPVGMLTDVMQADGALVEPSMKEAPVEVAEPLPAPHPPPNLEGTEHTTWTAEPAEMTAEEAKLFEQPSANWGDLEQMVEQTSGEPEPLPAPAPFTLKGSGRSLTDRDPGLEAREAPAPDAPIETDPLLYRPEEYSPLPEDPLIEHYESLDEVVEAQGPVQLAPEPVPPASSSEEVAAEFSGPVEELEASPEERNLPPVEQLVRQAVDDLMPEIIDRVKRSLQD
jgi:CheY-like chemotaxis protein